MPLFLEFSDFIVLVIETNPPVDLPVFFHVVCGFFWETLTRNCSDMEGCLDHAVESGNSNVKH